MSAIAIRQGKRMDTTTHLTDLYRISAEIGQDLDLIQGAGGNTSLKVDGILWVKASGRRLNEAAESNIFVPLNLDCCRTLIAAGDADNLSQCIPDKECENNNLRPSIETALHAILPHICVIHAHAVNTIAVSLQPSLNNNLKEAMNGLAWLRVPYVKPGAPLASLISQKLKQAQADIVILDNHGVVVGAQSPAEARDLLRDVETRLLPLVRERPPIIQKDNTELYSLCASSHEYEPAPKGLIQALAFDPTARQAVSRGTLYPDHVVFLGPGVAIVEVQETIDMAAARASAEHNVAVKTVIIPEIGVAVHRDAGSTGLEMLDCLARIAFKINKPEEVQTISQLEVLKLVNWEAETYRKALSS